MAKTVRALVASVVLVACGSADDTLFAPKGNTGGSGPDAGPSSGSATSSGGSGGNSSGTGGASTGGSSATGGRNATGGGSQTDGSAAAGGATTGDGSTDGAPDGSADSSTGGSGGSGGGNGGAGGRATGGRGGAGGPNTGGRSGTGGKGGTPGDGGVLTPTPGVIACAGTPCTIAGTIPNVCCFGGLTSSCLPSFPGCVQFGVSVACDDAADCDSGSICCRSALGSTSCAKTCTGNQTQLCRTTAECKAGACRPFAQTPAYSTCQ